MLNQLVRTIRTLPIEKLKAAGVEHWTEEQFVGNLERPTQVVSPEQAIELLERMTALFRTRSAQEWEDTINEAGTANSVNNGFLGNSIYNNVGLGIDLNNDGVTPNDLDDPDTLNALRGTVNESKGDKGPEAWRPPLPATWCAYAQGWARIKATWGLTVTSSELAALKDMATTCA